MAESHHNPDHPIANAMTRSAFINVFDALAIGKLKFHVGTYRGGEGAQTQAVCYADMDAMRVVFRDILNYGRLPAHLYPESKIQFYGGSGAGDTIQARVLTFEWHEDKTKIMISCAVGPGRKNQNGGIQPIGKMTSTAIFLSAFDGRKLAATVLGEIDAWTTLQVFTRGRMNEESAI